VNKEQSYRDGQSQLGDYRALVMKITLLNIMEIEKFVTNGMISTVTGLQCHGN